MKNKFPVPPRVIATPPRPTDVMEDQRVKRCLGQQMELLAEASKSIAQIASDNQCAEELRAQSARVLSDLSQAMERLAYAWQFYVK